MTAGMGEPDREQWHAARRRCITASWVPAVLGFPCPAGTGLDAWAYLRHDVRATETDAMSDGRRLEAVILEWFADTTGLAVEHWPQNILCGGEPDIWGATPDGLTASGAPVEAKSWVWGGDWAHGPPLSVLIQVQVQIHCLGAEHGWVAALIGGQFRRWRVERHDDIINRGRSACRVWWARHIDGAEIPPVDGASRTTRLLRRLYKPSSGGAAVELPREAAVLRDELARSRTIAKDWTEIAALKANELRLELGENAYGVCPGGEVISNTRAGLRLIKKLPRGVETPAQKETTE